MEWTALNSLDQLEEIKQASTPVIIFKHSTRCPISSMAKRNVELQSDSVPEGIPVYLLDLIRHREISNAIEQTWNVKHESPQILTVANNKCIYHASHNSIDLEDAVAEINKGTA